MELTELLQEGTAMRSFNFILLVSLIKGMTYGLVFVAALVVLNTEASSVEQSSDRKHCFNKYTGGVKEVLPGTPCPKVENPFYSKAG